ncbi:protein O-linked-mannose beta-1,4-N-acetylglucosaminyltransferase 2-like [Cimex lectularius]|uniref:Glycosyltransferase 61 catalytic domain-containing protein n=1 Tax=Cimex lectularius TaxID=79782 RepID=A0A8I6TKH1_CIMLE|nr:protein O-linked-mannose beta-1,4-N-acetylglucosaminyltransferase 2-like [Cimex lectularius]XP_014260123.1 protein O-linked-mannose beta-1,4-N-acetylglucosaminyltransferase 2-like [Cimex lectularius]XP_014260132.1 protein O-linked-mannose beta-1,4-N-acetylglucosaminyltransferase 2-like [Cimex lectularius]
MKIDCKYNTKSFPLVFTMLILLLYLSHSQVGEYTQKSVPKKTLSTSVWCQTSKFGNKKCSFQNLCFNKYLKFLFVLTESSILSGVKLRKDLETIKTSSVTNNSAFFLKMSIVFPSQFPSNDIEWFHDDIFALTRFKPDNIMHVIHDDLLPLHSSYKELCLGNVYECSRRFQLAFLDEHGNGPFIEWYKAYSSKSLIHFSSFEQSKTICFSKLVFAIDEDTVFYQYGYKIPHGPVHTSLSPALILDFKNYMLGHFNIKHENVPKTQVYTLLSRKFNRKLLNEAYIIEMINQLSLPSKPCVLTFDVVQNSTNEILTLISSSSLFIGMHGAGMMLSIFLPKDSSVVELFPFAIHKEYVSPLYALTKLKGLHFRYNSWTNLNKNNSVLHPEYPSKLGGVNHLPRTYQLDIINSNSVPPVFCCDNPLYLFWMYQDTIVDSSIIPVLNSSLITKYTPAFINKEKWFFPGSVRNFKIGYFETVLFASWSPPFNTYGINVSYSLLLSTPFKNVTLITNEVNVTLNFNKRLDACHGWVLCIFDGIEGVDTFSKCNDTTY